MSNLRTALTAVGLLFVVYAINLRLVLITMFVFISCAVISCYIVCAGTFFPFTASNLHTDLPWWQFNPIWDSSSLPTSSLHWICVVQSLLVWIRQWNPTISLASSFCLFMCLWISHILICVLAIPSKRTTWPITIWNNVISLSSCNFFIHISSSSQHHDKQFERSG